MRGSTQFFETGWAQALDDPGNHPGAIAAFLVEERRLVERLLATVDVLVETACGAGRYLDAADAVGVRYLGLDVAPEAVEAGRARLAAGGWSRSDHAFKVGRIEELAPCLATALADVEPRSTAVLLPFSILSALSPLDDVGRALSVTGRPFLATMYATSAHVIAGRQQYYERCGLTGISVHVHSAGVTLATAEGLTTTAYRPDALAHMWARHGLEVMVSEHNDVLVAFAGRPTDGSHDSGFDCEPRPGG